MSDDQERAEEILEEMTELMEELDRIFRRADKLTYDRFKAYPRASITMALSDEHDYLGSCPCDIKSLIEDLDDSEKDEEDENDD